ncbi:1-deoxy-D-xylulose-5-phosphate synthase, partial [Francisella tularensis subsp. holarctica]|nr:1-deoxy-D-xylulose-5-phosphate synthase [Francisella tularensis subsp. holarctica]
EKIMLDKVSQTHEIILTLEENCIAGGSGSAVNEYFVAKDLSNKIIVRNFGLQDKFLNHGTKDLLLAQSKICVENISKELDKLI